MYVSSHLIAGRSKRLDEKHNLVTRVRNGQIYTYSITDKANKEYFQYVLKTIFS